MICSIEIRDQSCAEPIECAEQDPGPASLPRMDIDLVLETEDAFHSGTEAFSQALAQLSMSVIACLVGDFCRNREHLREKISRNTRLPGRYSQLGFGFPPAARADPYRASRRRNVCCSVDCRGKYILCACVCVFVKFRWTAQSSSSSLTYVCDSGRYQATAPPTHPTRNRRFNDFSNIR